MNLFEEGKKMKLVGTKEKDQTWAELQIWAQPTMSFVKLQIVLYPTIPIQKIQ